uniref:Uncharacterized protein n=1 Tax=Rhizophora mucronata TaxID=61149 RepID=A0A2P2J863_RHIMU
MSMLVSLLLSKEIVGSVRDYMGFNLSNPRDIVSFAQRTTENENQQH